MTRALVAVLSIFALVAAPSAQSGSQTTPQSPPAAPKPAAEPDEGIPITNDTVRRVCGPCHKNDSKNRMSRISYRRTTPEGWQETIRRMVDA